MRNVPAGSSTAVSSRLALVVSAISLALFATAACGGETNGTTLAGGTGGATPSGPTVTGPVSSGGTSLSGSGPGGPSCTPTCVAPEICSAAGKCIPEGACAADADCKEEGTLCDLATSTCVPGGECGAQELQADTVVPDMLIVLDRSCSMNKLVDGKTKWVRSVAALKKLTTEQEGAFRFGLILFPDTEEPQCEQGDIAVPVADANEAKIQALLANALKEADPNFPNGPCVTNIDTAMSQAQTKEPAFKSDERKHYAVLISDGAQSGSCGGNAKDAETEATIKALKDAGILTYVIGFGAASDFASLDAFAVAGGTALPGAKKYYLAENQPALEAAFADIATKSLSCTVKLQENPPDPSKIFVFFNDTDKIASDPKEGWQYDAAKNEVTFFGKSCEQLKSGQVTDVDIVFGCDVATPN